MNPINIFMCSSELEQKLIRKFYIDMFEIYTEQLTKMMQDNTYTISEKLKN